ncbi:MAG: hypothetical protein ABI663_12650 [Chryseolinea sp.]
MKELISGLNLKQITIHIVATLLLVIGLKQFSFLTDMEFTEHIITKQRQIDELGNGTERLASLLIWIEVSRMVGFAISGLIMFQLTRKLKYFWINVLIVLLSGYLITRLELFNSDVIKKVTLFPGRLFSKAGPFYPYLINGLFLTGLALLVFYNGRIKQFIGIQQNQIPEISK